MPRHSRKSASLRPSSSLDGEHGTIRRQAGAAVALGYPAPYAVAASSLCFQAAYRAWNRVAGLACTRFFAPDRGPAPRPLRDAETERPVSAARAIAFSVSCETELAGVVELLEAAGLAPLAEDRTPGDPPVIVGGPLTLLDPRLVAPLSDLVAVGEADALLAPIGEAVVDARDKDGLLDALDRSQPGLWIPARHAEPPAPARAALALLPARAVTWSPRAELRDLFLVEAARGCKRGCTFCLLSSRTDCAGRFRAIPAERVIEAIPKDAPGVGLVGAAVTDHPEIEALVEQIVDDGKRVSLSSIRADRLSPALVEQLVRGGLRTLTLAADGSSERLRKAMRKGISEQHLLGAAWLAREAGIKGIKLYSMLGLPGEEDEDVAELAELIRRMPPGLRVSIAVQALVPKPGTPLAGEPMADQSLIRRRLALLKRLLAGRARLVPTSPRWSFIDWKLAHAKERAAHAAIAAHHGGGSYGAWKKAILDLGL